MVAQALIMAALVAAGGGDTTPADAGAPPASVVTGPRLLAAPPTGTESFARRSPQYLLERATDGTGDLSYDGGAFTARVHRDGSVVFDDHHLRLTLLPLLFGFGRPPKPPVPSLEQVIRQRLTRSSPTPASTADSGQSSIEYGVRLPIPEVTPYRPDPREACRYPSDCFFHAQTVLVTVIGSIDLTDELMRVGGQDPYRYEKARFLAETRELRARMAARAHADDLRRSARELRAQVSAVACDSTRSVTERRLFLHALRDELDASTPEGVAAVADIDRAIAQLRPGPDGAAPCR